MRATVQLFSDLSKEQQSLAGGKGRTLAKLFQAHYPVPPGLVVLPTAFIGDELSAEAWVELQTELAHLQRKNAHTSFAVRSSASAEDSTQASFAGEFETALEVRGDQALREAIQTVRRSRHSERVQAYSQAQKLADEHEMAVVVQVMIPAEISGVLFTADPVTGSRDNMLGNYVHGLGEQLVSGEASPHSFGITQAKGRYEGPAELKRFARRLFKLAKRLEQELGGPQDIEWAIANGKVYILQSRPITTLQGYNPATGEYNDSLTGDFVWSCVNVGEAMSVVMTPFTWSVLEEAYNELNLVPGYPSVGNIGGRPYQNVTVMISLFNALGRDMKSISTEMGGVREEYKKNFDQYLFPIPGINFFTVLPSAVRMIRKQRQGLRNLGRFLAENPIWCRDACKRVPAMKHKEELISFSTNELMPHAHKGFWKVFATNLYQGEYVSKLRQDLLNLVDAQDADALLSNLSNEDELLASLGPLVGLTRVVRGEMSRQAYLEQWGHRGPMEIEAYYPRQAEDPNWLDQQLETLAQSPADAEALLAAKRDEFEAAWSRFEQRYPRQVKPVKRRLIENARAARMREAVRSELTRLVWVARVWALQVAELTGLGDGVFFLTYNELLDLLAGKDAPLEYIPARQQTYQRYKALPPYPLLIRGHFDPFQWAADPDRRTDVYDSHGLLPELGAWAHVHQDKVLGMPGSAGRVEGIVRRLDSPEEGDQLQLGEILVTSQTNIGWTLLFPKIAGIVTDIGAPLSHAAVVARELGIPAVVNCGVATTRLHTGDRVRVDGIQGIVEILETAH